MVRWPYMWDSKRHRCIEQTFGLCGRRRGWENSIETCILPYVKQIASPGSMDETDRMLRAGALGWPWGMGWGGRVRMGTCTHVNPWLIHVNVWQKPLLPMQEMQVQYLGWKIPWRRKWQPTPVFLDNLMDRGFWWAVIHEVTKESDMT